MAQFVNRSEEFSRLRGLFDSDDPELAVVYGRRRLGKTRLVTHALEKYDDAVVYLSTARESAVVGLRPTA